MLLHNQRTLSFGLFGLGWWLANSLSFGLVGAVFHNFNLLLNFPPTLAKLGAFELTPAIVGLFFGGLPALLPGALQWWLLRRHWPLSRWWLATGTAGVGLEHLLADGFPNARDLSVAVVVSSTVMAVLQWRLLRSHVGGSGWWAAATVVGWMLGWVGGLNLLITLGLFRTAWTPTLGLQHHGLLGLAIGSAYSFLTGIFLFKHMTHPSTQEPVR